MHPFDDVRLFAGYGSIALEILEDFPEVEVVIIPCGGGGLLAGISSAMKIKKPDVKVLGVEPEGAAKMYQSFQLGYPYKLEKISTFANGLSAPYAGKLAYQHARKYVDDIILVTDDEIKAAMKLLYEDLHLVVESAGAAPLAALMNKNSAKYVRGKKVVCVVSGGNISLAEMSKLFL